MCRIVQDFDLEFSYEDVLRGQGVQPSRATKRMITDSKEVLNSCLDLIKPISIYDSFKINEAKGEELVINGNSLTGPLLKCATVAAESIYIAICTIGGDLDNKLEILIKESPTKALSLEGLGISAIGKVAKIVENLINSDAAALGFPPGIRLQPGQEGWPLEEQKKLFSLLKAENIGVSLSSSCLMTPRKSLSFIIVTGPGFNLMPNPCADCPKKEDCNWKLLKDH